MRFDIVHTTTYSYPRPARLGPHDVKLRPRESPGQRLRLHKLDVVPEPVQWDEQLDAEGNTVVRMWFDGSTQQLQVKSTAIVDVDGGTRAAVELDPDVVRVPLRYRPPVEELLQSYRARRSGQAGREAVETLAGTVRRTHGDDTLRWLDGVAEWLEREVRQVVREDGGPLPADEVLAGKVGACRDLAVTMMETCRAMGLAARFVSGYQEGRPEQKRYLHAWAEVFLPGLGWRAWDPSMGKRVGDSHVAVAHSAVAGWTTPIFGHFWSERPDSSLAVDIAIVRGPP